MPRRLVTLAAAASLLLCAATAALWMRSYWRADGLAYVWQDNGRERLTIRNTRGIFSNIGELTFVTGAQTGPRTSRPETRWQLRTLEAASDQTPWQLARDFPKSRSGRFLGLGFIVIDGGGLALRAVSLPHWLVVLLTALAPALRARAVLRARRVNRSGHCPTCGYDLRATPDRCPECGAVPAAPAAR